MRYIIMLLRENLIKHKGLLCAWYGKFVIHIIFYGSASFAKIGKVCILRKVRIFFASAHPPARSGLILFHNTA